jgi:hypothetical protein
MNLSKVRSLYNGACILTHTHPGKAPISDKVDIGAAGPYEPATPSATTRQLKPIHAGGGDAAEQINVPNAKCFSPTETQVTINENRQCIETSNIS